jgi:hypothetical protein
MRKVDRQIRHKAEKVNSMEETVIAERRINKEPSEGM